MCSVVVPVTDDDKEGVLDDLLAQLSTGSAFDRYTAVCVHMCESACARMCVCTCECVCVCAHVSVCVWCVCTCVWCVCTCVSVCVHV